MRIEDFSYFKGLDSTQADKAKAKVQELDLDIQLSEPSSLQPLVNEQAQSGAACILTISCSSCQTKTPTICVSC